MDMIARGMAAGANTQLSQITAYIPITDTANVFTIPLLSKTFVNATMVIADNTAKTIVVTDPTVGDEIFIELTYTDGAAITYTLSTGSTLTWLAGSAPTLVDGKTYRFAFFYKATNVWHGTYKGGW